MNRRIMESARLKLREEGGKRYITGHAAVFYDGTEKTEYRLWRDLVERVDKHAFDRAIKEKQDVRVLFNHDTNTVLGRTKAKTASIWTDEIGLAYEAEIPDTQAAKDLVVLLERGDITGASFSFSARSTRYEEDYSVTTLLDVDIFDVGPVVFPAYEGAESSLRAVGDVTDIVLLRDSARKEKKVLSVDKELEIRRMRLVI